MVVSYEHGPAPVWILLAEQACPQFGLCEDVEGLVER